MHDSLVRDRIVCGITDDQVRGRLLREADRTPEKAIDICRASEITTSQVKAPTEEVEINRVRTDRQKGKLKANTEQNESSCSRCGFKHGTKKCPAIGQTCKACNKKNHFAKMCRSQSQQHQQRKNVHAVEQSEEEITCLLAQLERSMRNA